MHFEEGNCYFRPFREASKIQFVDLGSGLFQLRGENALTLPGSFCETVPNPNPEDDAKHTFSVNGQCFQHRLTLICGTADSVTMSTSQGLFVFSSTTLWTDSKCGGVSVLTALATLALRQKSSGNQFRMSVRWKVRPTLLGTRCHLILRKYLTRPSEVSSIVFVLLIIRVDLL